MSQTKGQFLQSIKNLEVTYDFLHCYLQQRFFGYNILIGVKLMSICNSLNTDSKKFGGNKMKKQFEAFLIRKGYKQYTPSGNPSTVYDYIKRIDKVCEWESITWQTLAANISIILPQYDVGGIKEDFGHKSHNAVISALRSFTEFLSASESCFNRVKR